MIIERNPLQKSNSARQLRLPLSPSRNGVPENSDFVSKFRKPFRSTSERILSRSQDVSGTEKNTVKSALYSSVDGLQSVVGSWRHGAKGNEVGKSQEDGLGEASERRRKHRSVEEEWAAIRKRYEAPAMAKMFVITGQFSGIREALLDRGWVEHQEHESTCFDLKWTVKTSQIDFEKLQPHQIVNHFAKNQHVTTKVGLSKSLRCLQWFEEVDRDTFFPRSYDLNDAADVISFTEDFMMLAAQNAVEDGLDNLDFSAEASLDQDGTGRFVLALMALEDYLKHCSVGDLSEEEEEEEAQEGEGEVRISSLSPSDWKAILSEACPDCAPRLVGREGQMFGASQRKAVSDLEKIVDYSRRRVNRGEQESPKKGSEGEEERSSVETEEGREGREGRERRENEWDLLGLEELRERGAGALKGMRAISAQSCLNGRQNVWIVKPAGKSRGRGIQVVKKLGDILSFVTDARRHNTERWVVQKYLEDPLLIRGRKFDIRQWVLVSDWNPLSVWFYDECYLRFALADFQLENLEDNLVHLCNNCVQREGPDFEARKEESMWDASTFRAWLEEQGEGHRWHEHILPQLKRVSVWAVMSAQDNLINRRSSCELFGYDLMLDSDYNVWLLEVNSSPDMAATTPVTERLCRQCLYDVVRVVVDYKEAEAGRGKGGRRGEGHHSTALIANNDTAYISDSPNKSHNKSNANSTADNYTFATPDKAAGLHTTPALDTEGQARRGGRTSPHASPLLTHSDTSNRAPIHGPSEDCGALAEAIGGVPVATGGWQLVHRGEVEACVPVAVSGKLRVEGSSMRIHRPGLRDLITKLGMDGTDRKSSFRVAGSAKVWTSRWEMLKDINTMAPMLPLHQHAKLRKRKAKTPSKAPSNQEQPAAAVPELPSVVERMRQWEENKQRKMAERAKKQREAEEAEAESLLFKPKSVISHHQAEGFMARMHKDAVKRDTRIKAHAERVQEGVRKLERASSVIERGGGGGRKQRAMKRGGSMKVRPKQRETSSESESDESDD